ncbi:MAG: Uma2 family endonuclease [Planctomycetota bacterium]
MHLIIDLPDREESMESHRQRWVDICEDVRWKDTLERIETNALGQIIMTPPAEGPHYSRQSEIAYQLRVFLGGKGFGDCAILTSDGVKIADAGWYSTQRYGAVRGQSAFSVAPEICVEVISRSNTANELQNKIRLYFEAGAIECWLCDLSGQMTYYLDGDADTPHPKSKLCPDFPREMSD